MVAVVVAAKVEAKVVPVKRVQKKKAKKDPNAPKKPMSPFFCYQHVRRPKIKAENPTISNTDIIKTMAAEWRAMNPEQQQPFINETAQHKKRYEEEKKVYVEVLRVQKVEDDRIAAEKAKADAVLEKKLAKKNAKAAAKVVVKPAEVKPVVAKKEEKKEVK